MGFIFVDYHAGKQFLEIGHGYLEVAVVLFLQWCKYRIAAADYMSPGIAHNDFGLGAFLRLIEADDRVDVRIGNVKLFVRGCAVYMHPLVAGNLWF